MKKPTKMCKHALGVIDYKWFYNEDEIIEGCWKCGGPLTKCNKPIRTNLDHVSMDDSLREQFNNDPDLLKTQLDLYNRPEWFCTPCQKRKSEQRKKDWEEGRNNSTEINEAYLEYLKSEEHRREHYERLDNLIKEIEECGEDCCKYKDLPSFRRSLESYKE